jgi:hypothetical protein
VRLWRRLGVKLHESKLGMDAFGEVVDKVAKRVPPGKARTLLQVEGSFCLIAAWQVYLSIIWVFICYPRELIERWTQ